MHVGRLVALLALGFALISGSARADDAKAEGQDEKRQEEREEGKREEVKSGQRGDATFTESRPPSRASETSSASPGSTSATSPSSSSTASALGTSLVLSGYIQADAVLVSQGSQDEVDGSTGEPLNEKRFLIRRARLRADYKKDILGAVLEVDGNTVQGPAFRLVVANVSIDWEAPDRNQAIGGRMGLMKIPFGREVVEPDSKRYFLERSSVAEAFFPGTYDIGAQIAGRYRSIHYSATAMNGAPSRDKQLPLRDPTESKDLVLRGFVDTELAPDARLMAGGSLLSGLGFHRGNPSTKDTLVWRDANEDAIVQLTEMQVIPGKAATPSQTFRRFAVGADLRLIFPIPVLGKLTALGELMWGTNMDRGLLVADPISQGRDLRELGWYAGITQEITKYGIVGARYDRYNPDANANEQQGALIVPRNRSYSTLAVIAGLRYDVAQFIVEYDHNTNALARLPSGIPGTLASDALIARAQVIFQ